MGSNQINRVKIPSESGIKIFFNTFPRKTNYWESLENFFLVSIEVNLNLSFKLSKIVKIV